MVRQMRRINTLANGLSFNRGTRERQRLNRLVERAEEAAIRYSQNINSRAGFTMGKQYSRNTYMGLSNG